ncbi:hypothetical protein INT47_007124 [Mucor saturninus]|uniref:Required for respiratory growth protein 9, mitochondrial n=1 Tax=Mucor saturninus TaxID=64648 RepID=A0A8H7QSM3_9FUNG|nr:hypothetical protein INT47_007124 [Mucor saturninus]
MLRSLTLKTTQPKFNFARLFTTEQEGNWAPKKRVSRPTMEKIRALAAADPEVYDIVKLSKEFTLSVEGIRRILKSNYVPEGEVAERQERNRYEAMGERRRDFKINHPEEYKKTDAWKKEEVQDISTAKKSSNWTNDTYMKRNSSDWKKVSDATAWSDKDHDPASSFSGERRSFNREGGEHRSFNREGGERRPFNREGGERRSFNRDGANERRPFNREGGERRSFDREGERKPYFKREDSEGNPFFKREDGERSFNRGGDGERRPFFKRDGERSFNRDGERSFSRGGDGERKPFFKREEGERTFNRRDDGERSFNRRDDVERSFNRRDDGERKPFFKRDGERSFDRRDGERSFNRRDGGERSFNRRDDGERKPFFKRDGGRDFNGDRPRRSFGGDGDRGRSFGGGGDRRRSFGEGDRAERSYSREDRSAGEDKPARDVQSTAAETTSNKSD